MQHGVIDYFRRVSNVETVGVLCDVILLTCGDTTGCYISFSSFSHHVTSTVTRTSRVVYDGDMQQL